MTEQPNPSEKKIIIDEDWKSSVEREREQTASAEKVQTQNASVPPATISLLFSTLATQAVVSLGLVPSPVTGKSETAVQQAKHFIDMLGVLEAKTKGNLTEAEAGQLKSILFDLRMAYVERQKVAAVESK